MCPQLPEPIQPEQHQFASGLQGALAEELKKKAPQLEIIYLGALKVLADQGNPDRLALAAHNFRELFEKVTGPTVGPAVLPPIVWTGNRLN